MYTCGLPQQKQAEVANAYSALEAKTEIEFI